MGRLLAPPRLRTVHEVKVSLHTAQAFHNSQVCLLAYNETPAGKSAPFRVRVNFEPLYASLQAKRINPISLIVTYDTYNGSLYALHGVFFYPCS